LIILIRYTIIYNALLICINIFIPSNHYLKIFIFHTILSNNTQLLLLYLINKLMTDKPKYVFQPSSPQYQPNALRTSFQAMSYNNIHHQNNYHINPANTNPSINI
jgi:hypothetical protein